jgi:plasmid stabilization system protein ParE
MSDFVLTKPAERDLDQIKTFLIKKAGPTVARKVFKDVRVALDLIGKEPGIGHTRILACVFLPHRL